jgi:hypothetical protein
LPLLCRKHPGAGKDLSEMSPMALGALSSESGNFLSVVFFAIDGLLFPDGAWFHESLSKGV